MKRPLNNSETLIALGPSDDDKVLYGRGFQSMMEGLDDEDCVDDDQLCSAMAGNSGGRSGEKKRRLSTEQVRALEKNFEVENKLEPERKVRLAHELGLQPRQVAVWFQNRRARWKTKQLERDYAALKASYDSLRVDYDALHHDKDALLTQIKELKAKLAEDESMSFSSVKEEPVVYKEEDEEEEKLILDNSDDLHPLIYKNGASTDSDSSAVFNDANLLNDENSPLNSNIIASHAAKDGEKIKNDGILLFSSGSSASAELNPIKGGGFSIYRNYQHHNPIMKIEESEYEEEPCSRIFTEEQAPSLNWWN